MLLNSLAAQKGILRGLYIHPNLKLKKSQLHGLGIFFEPCSSDSDDGCSSLKAIKGSKLLSSSKTTDFFLKAGTLLLRIPLELCYESQPLKQSSVYTTEDGVLSVARALQKAAADPEHATFLHAKKVKQQPVLPLLSQETLSRLQTPGARAQWHFYESAIRLRSDVEPWALIAVLSRSHFSKKRIRLVPFLDLANHGDSVHAANTIYQIWIPTQENKNRASFLGVRMPSRPFIDVHTTKPVYASSEVLYPYSPFNPQSAEDRDRWLLYAGFLPSSAHG